MSYETPVGQLGASVPVDCDAPALTGQAVLWVVSGRSAALGATLVRPCQPSPRRPNPRGHPPSRLKARGLPADLHCALVAPPGDFPRGACSRLTGPSLTR